MAFKWVGMSPDGNSVTLRRLDSFESFNSRTPRKWLEENQDEILEGLAVDVETTGLRPESDSIIEICLRRFRYHRSAKRIVEVGSAYSCFQDPGYKIPLRVNQITGISDEDVRGKQIDWKVVSELISESNIVVSHNASFDRPFVDKHAAYSKAVIWCCSLRQINWLEHGYSGSKLELLSIYHGFFERNHRASADVNMLLALLAFEEGELGGKQKYFSELLENAYKPRSVIWLLEGNREHASTFRNSGFRWNPARRGWFRVVPSDAIERERSLADQLVKQTQCAVEVVEIPLSENFKDGFPS